MNELLLTRPPWYVIGVLLGLTVVGVLATLNQRLGALGGYSAVFESQRAHRHTRLEGVVPGRDRRRRAAVSPARR